MAHDSIVIRGAREHNLADVDVDIPRDQLVVITGLSGSGKSSTSRGVATRPVIPVASRCAASWSREGRVRVSMVAPLISRNSVFEAHQSICRA